MPRTVTSLFVAAPLVFFGALFSHNLQVAGFAAKEAAIQTGSAAPSAQIANRRYQAFRDRFF